MRYNSIFNKMAINKKWKITRVGKEVEKLEPLCTVDGNDGAVAVKNRTAISQKIKHRIIMIQQFYF